MAIHFASSVAMLPFAPDLHLYEWTGGPPGSSGYASGPTVAKVRFALAWQLKEVGYVRTIGAALKAIKVKRFK